MFTRKIKTSDTQVFKILLQFSNHLLSMFRIPGFHHDSVLNRKYVILEPSPLLLNIFDGDSKPKDKEIFRSCNVFFELLAFRAEFVSVKLTFCVFVHSLHTAWIWIWTTKRCFQLLSNYVLAIQNVTQISLPEEAIGEFSHTTWSVTNGTWEFDQSAISCHTTVQATSKNSCVNVASTKCNDHPIWLKIYLILPLVDLYLIFEKSSLKNQF